jgi:spore coat protein U-like protein
MLAALAALVVQTNANALTSTGTFTVFAGIATNCTIAGGGYGLGSYATTTADINATLNLSVTCTNLLPFNIDLDPGQHPTASNASRQLAAGTGRTLYNLYTTSAYTQVWGSAMQGGVMSGANYGTGAPQTLSMYMKIPAQTLPPAGYYSDTVTVTAAF